MVRNRSWIPNLLSTSRIVLLVPIILLLEAPQPSLPSYQLAFALFLISGLTDLLDGWAARRLECTSSLGAFLDPLADKVMTNVLLVFLSCRFPALVPLWIVLLLLAREFAVQGFRSMAPCVGVLLGTDRLSKLKTFFQLFAAGAVIAGIGWQSLLPLAQFLALLALFLALASAYLSAVWIFYRNWDLWSRPPLPLQRR